MNKLFTLLFIMITCTSCILEDEECCRNSSEQVIAGFQKYFCNSDGEMLLSRLDDDNPTTWVGCVMTGTRACEIFNDITGLYISAKESYSSCYKSADGSVEITISGSTTANSNAIYATLFVRIPEYPDVERILIVAPEYSDRVNAGTVITVIV